MHIDLEQAACDQILSADLCIIGAGAAGITLAREFIGSSCSLVLLEGGGPQLEPKDQETYQSQVVGLAHTGIHTGRARAFGGTTVLWAGQALPLFEIDFAAREWVPYSGWPISRADLMPYYHRAEEVMQIGHVDYGPKTWPAAQVPPYNTRDIVPLFSQFTATPNFATKYGAAIRAASNIQVVVHANVTSLEANESAARVTEVRALSLCGRRVKVRSRYVVLCAGGIETARLLLLSDSVERRGIGNRYDVVGRFFQDHPHVSVPVERKDPKRFHHYCDSFRRKKLRVSFKMAASPSLQSAAGIPHIGAEVYYPLSGEGDSLNAAKTFLKALHNPGERKLLLPSLALMVRDPIKILRSAYRFYFLGQPASVGSTHPRVGFFCEQEPNPQSRVMLSADKDGLGMRRTRLDWRLSGSETRAVQVLARAIESEWSRLNIGALAADLFHAGPIRFADLNHHMGTARMGTDQRVSVVDPHCRVHGYDNLYIGGSATFPTGGFSNPTLTIIALVLRIADELKKRLGQTTKERDAGTQCRTIDANQATALR